jgi:predicted Zn-dependent peptidase
MHDNLFTKKKMTQHKFDKYKKSFQSQLLYKSTNNDNILEFTKRYMYLKEKMTIESNLKYIDDLTLDQFVNMCNTSLNLNKLGCYIISKKPSQKEHIDAFKKTLSKFKNEVW